MRSFTGIMGGGVSALARSQKALRSNTDPVRDAMVSLAGRLARSGFDFLDFEPEDVSGFGDQSGCR